MRLSSIVSAVLGLTLFPVGFLLHTVKINMSIEVVRLNTRFVLLLLMGNLLFMCCATALCQQNPQFPDAPTASINNTDDGNLHRGGPQGSAQNALARSPALLPESFKSDVLPDGAQPVQIATPPGTKESQQASTASLSGTVLDTRGDVLQGARLTLAYPPGAIVRTAQSGNNGQFAFTGLPPNVYKLTVSAPGMTTFSSTDITLHAGEARIVTGIKLSVAPVTTTVTVNGNKQELAEQQVHIAEQQRIGGVLPNFYSTYDWNAPPMQAKQKFQLSIRSIIDPVSFLSVAGIAGAEQYENVFPGYGGGIEGYGKRYGAALANHVAGTLLGRAVYPSMFHQDPRYFYKGKGSTGSRALYAIFAAVIAKGDDGRWKPNYSQLLAHFSAAALSNLYYPASDRGASLVIVNGFAGIGGNAVSNLLREFVFKRFTSHVPKGANGNP